MLLTTGQAAEELGCAITTFRRLVRADLLPDLSRHGVRVMVPLKSVHALRDRPTAALEHLPAREIGVLRVDAAQRVQEEDRQWIGFSTRLPPADLLKALRGWWRCDAASVAAGGVLPITLAGYVVAVLTGLTTWEKGPGGRHAFPEAVLAGYLTDVVRPVKELIAERPEDRQLADSLLGLRLPSQAGGPIAYVTTTPPAAPRHLPEGL